MSLATSGPIHIKHVVRNVMAGIPKPEGLIPDVPPTEAYVPVVPANRDELRNLWANALAAEVYSTANPPEVARCFFRGRSVLEFTEKCAADFETGLYQDFPQIIGQAHRLACSAFYQEGGWLVLWSQRHGTGKTTYALAHILRHLRILAEGLADKGIKYSSAECVIQAPTVVFESWPRAREEIKHQFGRTSGGRVIDKLKLADILVIEDIGQMKDWEHSTFESLLQDRYNSGRRTIIALRKLAKFSEVGEVLGTRIESFVAERGFCVDVGGDGFRAKASLAAVETPF
jgi:hypothetical protein